MKMTVRDLTDLQEAFRVLGGRQLGSVQANYRFGRAMLSVREAVTLGKIVERKAELQRKFMTPMKDGSFKPIPEKKADLDAAWEAILNEEIDVEVHRFELEDFDKMVPMPEPWILAFMTKCGCLVDGEDA